MKRVFIVSLALALWFFGTSNWVAGMSSENYQIESDGFGVSGQENQTSENYILSETVGETIANSATSSSANYAIKDGFREMYQDLSLTFSVGSNSVSLGTLSATEAKTASHTMSITTNAPAGFNITVAGATLTSGGNTIDAVGGTAAASSVGTEQFGINLVANTSPAVGANPSGTSPIGAAASQYNTANYFAYRSNDTIATSSAAINATTYTVSYLANVSSATESGNYATTLTYTATANW